MEYNYNYLVSLNPKEFSNLYKQNLGNRELILKIIPDFIHKFCENNIGDGGSLFLSGSAIQTPGSIMLIQVIKNNENSILWRQIETGKNWINIPNGTKWFVLDLDKFESALFMGMTRCETNINAPLAFRRCFKDETQYADMLDYIQQAEENDGLFKLNENKNYINNKTLYESIMSKLSEVVKTAINEENIDNHDNYKNHNNYNFYVDICEYMQALYNLIADKNHILIENIKIYGKNTITNNNVCNFSTGYISGLMIESAIIDIMQKINFNDKFNFKRGDVKKAKDGKPVYDLEINYNNQQIPFYGQIKAVKYDNLKEKNLDEQYAINNAIRNGNNIGIVIIYKFQENNKKTVNVILKEIQLYVPDEAGNFLSITKDNKERLLLNKSKSLIVINDKK